MNFYIISFILFTFCIAQGENQKSYELNIIKIDRGYNHYTLYKNISFLCKNSEYCVVVDTLSRKVALYKNNTTINIKCMVNTVKLFLNKGNDQRTLLERVNSNLEYKNVNNIIQMCEVIPKKSHINYFGSICLIFFGWIIMVAVMLLEKNTNIYNHQDKQNINEDNHEDKQNINKDKQKDSDDDSEDDSEDDYDSDSD